MQLELQLGALDHWDRIPIGFLRAHRRFYLRVAEPKDRLQLYHRVLTWSTDTDMFRLFGSRGLYRVTHWRGHACFRRLIDRDLTSKSPQRFAVRGDGTLLRRTPFFSPDMATGWHSVDQVPWEIHMISDPAAYAVAYETFCRHA